MYIHTLQNQHVLVETLKQADYLVEEVLHEFRDAYVVVVSVDEQHLLEVFELGDGVVTVPHCLTTLFTHDTWRSTQRVVIYLCCFFRLYLWEKNTYRMFCLNYYYSTV